jgi:hypothetical protein
MEGRIYSGETKIEKKRKERVWKAEGTGGETEIEKTRKGMKGRRYRGRDQDRVDKKGDGRQKLQRERLR